MTENPRVIGFSEMGPFKIMYLPFSAVNAAMGTDVVFFNGGYLVIDDLDVKHRDAYHRAALGIKADLNVRDG